MSFKIIKKRVLTEVTKLFVVEAPLVAKATKPGQFVVIRVHEKGESPAGIYEAQMGYGITLIMLDYLINKLP